MSPLLLAALTAGPVRAADPQFQVCLGPSGTVDAALTADWQRRLQTSEAAAVGVLVGSWVNESYNATVNMTVTTRISYLATGVMDFSTRTCSTMMGYTSCSDDMGHGLFTAHAQPDGSLFVTRNISSLTRTSQCGGNGVRQQGDTLVDSQGGVWTRLR